ncbi:TPA: Eco57I restriction-modification methylase domain-containing protein [Streptococcus suis]|nr:Eco57I restriction-modification methylase domain-containing protein [Streptococcus suis]
MELVQEINIDLLRETVSKFEKGFDEYTQKEYDETSTRVDFINNFFTSFGWDMNNSLSLEQNRREVIHEASVVVNEQGVNRKKKPDYLFQVNGEPAFYVEAKKPSVDILNDSSTSFQLRRYGWSAGFEYSILTNFKELVIYDCTEKPDVKDSSVVGVIAKFNFREYETQKDNIFKFISKTLIRERKSLSSSQRRLTSFDKYFLEQISKWRIDIAVDIHSNYPDIEEEAINLFVQKFINKSLFLRICEDNEFEKYEQLLGVSDYADLKYIFEKSDKIYNSGIFHHLESQDFHISIEVLTETFKDLYFPRSPYDFSVIPSSILAKVYDIFLQEKIIIKNEQVTIERKPETADFLGAISTPVDVANRIVKESIDRRLSNSDVKPEQLKVLDICCGSGIFLINSFEYICSLVLEDSLKNTSKSLDNNDIVKIGDSYKLSYKKAKEILENCIFGVDIDSSAVEVCKFSLLLNCLRYIDKNEFSELKVQGKILPNIDDKVLYANSLVDESFYDFMNDIEISDYSEVLQQINPANLVEEFGIGGKFDVVVGNPPYIRVQKMSKYSPVEYKYFKSDYFAFSLSKTPQLDKYYLFIERALELLDTSVGVCGYLVPNRFLHEKNGKYLRSYLSQNNVLSKIINFNEIQLFEGVSTYTCILIFDYNKSDELEYISISEKNELTIDEQNHQVITINKSKLNEEPWEIYSKRVQSWYEKIDDKFVKAKELVDIFVGLQTSKDDIFFIDPENVTDDLVFFTDKNKKQRAIEKSILREAIYKVRLFTFKDIETNKYLIFPYKDSKLIPVFELKKQYPLAYQYFKDFESELKNRSISPLGKIEEEWYRYGRSQSINKFEVGEQLIWSVLSLQTNFVYTETPIPFTGGGNGPYYGLKLKNDSMYSLFYIQAILNSEFISNFIEESSVYFANGYFSVGKQFVENVPIRLIDFSNDTEKNIHNKIVEIMVAITRLKNQDVKSSTQKLRIERALKYKYKELEKILKQLYEVE